MTLPYVLGSATSKATALAMAEKAEAWREKVHTFIGLMGEYGSTMDEAFLAFGSTSESTKWQTLSPRFGELLKDGYLILKGEQRPTSSGELAEVYIAVGSPGVCPKQTKSKAKGKKIRVENPAQTLLDLRALCALAKEQGHPLSEHVIALGLAIKAAV